MKVLEVSIKDKFDKLHKLRYSIYDTSLSSKWADLTNINLKNPNHKVSSVFNNRSEKDVPEITQQIKNIVSKITTEYDREITTFDELDTQKLNYLHEEFEIFGERMDELALESKLTETLTSNFFALNEHIHMCEDAMLTTSNTWGRFGVLYDIHPLGLHLSVNDEDKLYLEYGRSWGKLYLGYNTLGKDWAAVAKDNDIEVIARDMVKPQKRFSAEAWLYFSRDCLSVQNISFFQKWVKTLPVELQKKVPYHNLNELSLGKMILGELVIDHNFLKYDPNPNNWKIFNHPSKLKWNHEVFTTFRSVESIKLYK
jgi:hypothetical protein